MRQPWLFANSRTSSSDISRRTRNSAGWVTIYSELIESLSPILAARAGKSLCIFSSLAINRAICVRNFLPHRQRWRLLGFTIQPGTECMSSFATGGRATRVWFLHIDFAFCRGVCVSIPTKFISAHKRQRQFRLTGAGPFLG